MQALGYKPESPQENALFAIHFRGCVLIRMSCRALGILQGAIEKRLTRLRGISSVKQYAFHAT